HSAQELAVGISGGATAPSPTGLGPAASAVPAVPPFPELPAADPAEPPAPPASDTSKLSEGASMSSTALHPNPTVNMRKRGSGVVRGREPFTRIFLAARRLRRWLPPWEQPVRARSAMNPTACPRNTSSDRDSRERLLPRS